MTNPRDPIFNIIDNEIKRGIRVLLQKECYWGAVILIYSGMDTLACLGMPQTQKEVNRHDFITWAEKYIRFPCKEQLLGAELYAARCGMLHNSSPLSRSNRTRTCRCILYVDRLTPEVKYDPNASEVDVLVSITALAEAFFNGVNRSLIDIFADKDRAEVAEQRLRWIVQTSSA